MVCRTILLISLVPMVCEAVSSAPGYSVRIPRAGIDVFMDGVADDIEANAPKAPVPDMTIPEISGVSVTLKNVRFSKFERPSITYTLQEPNKLLAKVNVPSLELKGHGASVRQQRLPLERNAVTAGTEDR